jgi:hypothetical protein
VCHDTGETETTLLNQLAKERMMLRAFCVLIVLTMGFMTPVLAKSVQTGSQLSHNEWSLPDGTVPIICFGQDELDTQNITHCDECRFHFNQIAALPSESSTPFSIVFKLGTLHSASSSITSHDFLKRRRSRAPPLI